MKAYASPSGKMRWSSFWGDKVSKKIKKLWKKSARQHPKYLKFTKEEKYD